MTIINLLVAVIIKFALADSHASSMRIISTAPSITEIFYLISAQEQLVGITSHCHFPPETQEKKIVGDYMSIFQEKVWKEKADLVLLTSDNAPYITPKLKKLKITYQILKQNSIFDIIDSIRSVAKITHKETNGEIQINKINSQLQEIKAKAANIKNKKNVGKTVIIVGYNSYGITPKELYVAGSNSFLHHLLQYAGGENLLSDRKAGHLLISLEQLIKLNPDIIIDLDFYGPSQKNIDEVIEKRKIMWSNVKKIASIKALKYKQLHFITDPAITIPGPRFLGSIQKLQEILSYGQND